MHFSTCFAVRSDSGENRIDSPTALMASSFATPVLVANVATHGEGGRGRCAWAAPRSRCGQMERVRSALGQLSDLGRLTRPTLPLSAILCETFHPHMNTRPTHKQKPPSVFEFSTFVVILYMSLVFILFLFHSLFRIFDLLIIVFFHFFMFFLCS